MNRLSHGCAPLLLVLACASERHAKPKEPLGYLPNAVTTATPEWIPFRIRAGKAVVPDSREHHFADLRQLTFEGTNTHPHWSPAGRTIAFQSTRESSGCEQIFFLDLNDGSLRKLSTNHGGSNSPSFVYPQGERIVFALNESSECATKEDGSFEFNIHSSDLRGSQRVPVIVNLGFDGEPAVTFDGSRLAFTSSRDGNLELYVADIKGTGVRRATQNSGTEGGAAFSPDSTKLAWHAGHKIDRDDKETAAELEIMIAEAEGQNPRAATRNGKTNQYPCFFSDSRRLIFASNVGASLADNRDDFDLYSVDPEGPVTAGGMPRLERITYRAGFDGFPAFSPDGEYLAFVSTRNAANPGDKNLFVARWSE